jgi:hypothetical protein
MRNPGSKAHATDAGRHGTRDGGAAVPPAGASRDAGEGAPRTHARRGQETDARSGSSRA